MSQANLDAIYGQIDALPSLPSIVTEVLEVTGDPESSANDLMRAILPDQSMCATILKIANSAFFGLPREVSTVEKAVMVLGFDEVKNIVLGKAVFNSFKELNSTNREGIESFWGHCFNCGLAAKVLAERINLSPSELFISGLIHDIGKLAMLLSFPTIYSHLLLASEENWMENISKEKELFFISHDEVAYTILKRWLFPSQLTRAVGYHHRPEKTESFQLLAATVQMADIIAHIDAYSINTKVTDYKALMMNARTDVFDQWHAHQLPCDEKEVDKWFSLLKASQEKDTAILTIFTS
jgi:HD-like signal output (HDOD) protein